MIEVGMTSRRKLGLFQTKSLFDVFLNMHSLTLIGKGVCHCKKLTHKISQYRLIR